MNDLSLILKKIWDFCKKLYAQIPFAKIWGACKQCIQCIPIKRVIYGIAIFVVAIFTLLKMCGNDNSSQVIPPLPIPVDTTSTEVSPQEVVNLLQDCQDLITTEVYIRKMAYFLKEESIKSIKIIDISLGTRGCMVPVDIRLKYGYDLAQISINDVKVDNSKHQIWIFLPQIKTFGPDYEPHINMDSIISINTRFTKEISIEEIYELKNKALKEAKNDPELNKMFAQEVKANADLVFKSLFKKLGYDENDVIIVQKEQNHE